MKLQTRKVEQDPERMDYSGQVPQECQNDVDPEVRGEADTKEHGEWWSQERDDDGENIEWHQG